MRPSNRTKQRIILASLLLGLWVSATPAAEFDRRLQFSIPSQSLTSALMLFAQQSKIQVLTSSSELTGYETKGVEGSYTARAALAAILSGTNLTFREVGEGTVTIGRHAAAVVTQEDLKLAQTDAMRKIDEQGEVQEARKAKEEEAALKQPEREDQEVVVTGSLIRGAQMASPVTTLDREHIERSGLNSLQQVLSTLPQNNGGGITENTRGLLGGDNRNIGHGSAPNLRGLGSSSTLVLVDGHRLAPAGFGQFVDVSLIPLSAVDHIDVLVDGASATYGSDAVGGVINIVLRKTYSGAETHLDAGSVTSGHRSEYGLSQTVGHDWNSVNALLTYEFARQDNLDNQDRDYAQQAGEQVDLLPAQRSHTALGVVTATLSDDVRFRGTGLYSTRASSRSLFNARNRVAQRESATTDQFTATAGLDLNVGLSWQAEVYGLYSQNKTDSQLSATSSFDNSLESSSIEAKADGSVLRLPGGDAKLAVGSSFRREQYDPKLGGYTGSDRDVLSAFAELSIPLVGSNNSKAGLKSLEFSFAARYEDYSDFGTTTNPKFGVVWSPTTGLNLRGTYGTSFRAPLFVELDDFNSTGTLIYLPEAAASGGRTLTLLLTGSNAELEPEEATTWTAGFDLAIPSSPGAKLSFTYFDTHYKNRIFGPLPGGEVLGVYSQANIYSPIITRDPNDDVVASLIAAQNFFFNSFGPYTPSQIQAIVDRRLQNLSSEDVRGLDVLLGYGFNTESGAWSVQLASTYYFEFSDSITSSAPANDVLDTAYHQVDLKSRASVGWTTQAWDLSASVTYLSGYTNRTVTPAASVNSWTTADLRVAYSFSSVSGILSGTSVALSARNVFDRDPPRLASPGALVDLGFDPTNANPLGRFLSLAVTKKWGRR